MKREKIDPSLEKRIVTAMITNTEFLREIEPIFDPAYIKAPFCKTLARWSMDYFKEMGEAPGKHIQDIFQSQSRGEEEVPQGELMEEFLEKLSNEYERQETFNLDYMLLQTEKHFKKRKILATLEDARTLLAGGELDRAEASLVTFLPPSRKIIHGKNPFTDEEGIRRAFEDRAKPLFSLPGVLGEFLGPFCRDSFGAIMGSEKRGKTWWLIEIVMSALRAGCRVAYFQCGDLSEEQICLRFNTYLSKRHYNQRYCGKILVPVYDCLFNQTDECNLSHRSCSGVGVIEDKEPIPFQEADEDYRPCDYCRKARPKEYHGSVWYRERPPIEPLSWEEALKRGRKFFRDQTRELRYAVFPNDSISIDEIDQQLSIWEVRHGFVPDLIVADYMDITASIDSRLDFRHQENQKWQRARKISQERRCCFISATQADAKSYEAHSIREKNFSEDKRKYGHVNFGVITLNQTKEDKKNKIMRIGRMFVREDDFDIREEAIAMQCLEMGRPLLGSFMKKGK